MKMKSTVWQLLAAGSFAVGFLYALGIEGGAQVGGAITAAEFATALGLILAAVLFLRISFAVQDKEEAAGSKIHKQPDKTVKCGRRKAG